MTYIFSVVSWDDVDGKDVWVGDVRCNEDDPLIAKYENEAELKKISDELGGADVYVTRLIETES